jgi:hypothetical protein
MKRRDIKFTAFIAINLLAIVGFLFSHLDDETAYTGWRKIDYPALMQKINSGDLVRHKAEYWRSQE